MTSTTTTSNDTSSNIETNSINNIRESLDPADSISLSSIIIEKRTNLHQHVEQPPTTLEHALETTTTEAQKTKLCFTITIVTCSSYLIALLVIGGTISLGICDAVLSRNKFKDIDTEIYCILVAISIVFVGIGSITLIVGLRVLKRRYSVNSDGHLVNEKGERINVLGEVVSSAAEVEIEMDRSPISVKPYNDFSFI